MGYPSQTGTGRAEKLVFASRDLNRRAVYAMGTSSSANGFPAVAQRLALAAFGS
ncbi:hypothetical protein ACH4U5_02330 [Streptomyces sp. NPDC020858]|uniref:hypothetical protein n=1 Tax=Streptomyces sp. NPDC020858 TaxID=3365097 RepID=UPI00379336E2